MRHRSAFSVLPTRWRLIDQPLSVQFLVAGGLVAAFSVASLAILLLQVRSQTEVSHRLARTHRAIQRLDSLGSNLYRQRAAVFDYLGTGEKVYLESLSIMRNSWDEDSLQLRELMSDTPRQIKQWTHLKEGYEAWLALTLNFVQDAAPAKPKVLRLESALLKDTVLTLDKMVDSENKLLSTRDGQEKDQVRATFVAIATINFVLLIVFGVVLTKLYFSIAHPMSELLTGMMRYQDGDFGARVAVSNRSQIGYLEASFNEMAEKIEAMVGDLRKLDELKTEFLSTVSHELRTPLTSIGGYVKLLIGGDAGPVTDTQKEFLKIVDTNVGRLTRLINDILDAEALEAGKFQVVREPQDLNSILQECCETFRIVAQQKGLAIHYKVPEKLKAILGDRGRLFQIFMNLMSNAIKYTESGYIEVEAEEKEFAIVVRIRDTGVGLSKKEQERLFQKFYRTRAGLSSSEGGTGLGLVIVRGLVEAHAGQIMVESELNKGTKFTVTLPAEPTLLESPQTPHVALHTDTRKIWVIDQNEADREQILKLLQASESLFEKYKFEMTAFKSLTDVPEVSSLSEAPAVVIIDSQIGKTEHSMLIEIREKLHKTVPILLVSADVDSGVAFAEGASAILTKPIGEHEFTIAIKDLITTKGWRILVADHNTDLRILLKHALEQKGIQVDDVDHGNLVFGRLQQEYYDLVLIDMDLPDVSGVELTKAIRRSPRFDELSIFLMAEDSKRSPLAQDLSKWKANRFLGKQDGIEGIVNSVLSHLEEKKIDPKS